LGSLFVCGTVRKGIDEKVVLARQPLMLTLFVSLGRTLVGLPGLPGRRRGVAATLEVI
jgi:hypothetical protein